MSTRGSAARSPNVTGHLADGDTTPLMRLRYGGFAARRGFAIYSAGKDGYREPVLSITAAPMAVSN